MMNKKLFIQTTFIFLILLGGVGGAWAAPANDDYQNAVVTTLSQPLIEFEGTNFGATKELGEPDHARNIGGRSVWYRFVPQEEAMVRIYVSATSGGNYFNTLMAVYKGNDPSPFNLIAENDDMGYLTLSEVTLRVHPNTNYYVAIDGYNNDGSIAAGNFRLRFEKITVPVNDLPDVSPLTRLPDKMTGFASGSNHGATPDAPTGMTTSNVGGKSVWYIWQAPRSQAMTVRLSCNNFVGECFNMQLGVFKTSLANRVASNDDFDHDQNKSVASFYAEEGKYYAFGVDGVLANGAVSEGNFTIEFYPTEYRYDTNFDALDNKADLTVFRPGDGNWYTRSSFDGQSGIVNFGLGGDTPVPADYDGDAVTDHAVVRDSGGAKVWYFLNSADNSFHAVPFGLAGDKILTGDYDGDGRADLVAVRPAPNGLVWYIRPSLNPDGVYTSVFGLSSDQPVIGNFVKGIDTVSGLLSADLAVTRSVNGKKVWYVRSLGGANYGEMQFGLATDINVPADYDRDGYTDIAVWRPTTGEWFMYDESLNKVTIRKWGQNGDIPSAANLDNAGAPELIIFRPSTGDWWINSAAGSGSTSVIHWGAQGDVPTTGLTALMNP